MAYKLFRKEMTFQLNVLGGRQQIQSRGKYTHLTCLYEIHSHKTALILAN